MPDRSLDWLNQGYRDMEQAEDSRRAGRHDWACFAAHQAAEKAIKALHLHLGQEAWGHVLTKLLAELRFPCQKANDFSRWMKCSPICEITEPNLSDHTVNLF